jgi:signal transduction histidine kinase
MTLSLHARVVALTGAGVALAAGLFTVVVRPALESFERAVAREEVRTRDAVADAVARYAFTRRIAFRGDAADPELNGLLQPLRGASGHAALVDERGGLLAGDAAAVDGPSTTHVPGTSWTIRVSAGGDLADAVQRVRQRSLLFAAALALLAVAMAAGVTRELTTANRRLEDRERVRRRLLHRIITAQEDERKRVARELHDELSQSVAALGLAVDGAGLTSLRPLVQRISDELHRVIVDLRPSVLDDLGLASAVRWCAERLSARAVAVRCEIGDLPAAIPPDVETAVFRAVQEALVNIERHARAETALIQMFTDAGALVVEIEDDGVGFEPSTIGRDPGSLRGVGVLGMRERIEIVGGSLRVESEPGSGTRVVMRVPLEEVPWAIAS